MVGKQQRALIPRNSVRRQVRQLLWFLGTYEREGHSASEEEKRLYVDTNRLFLN